MDADSLIEMEDVAFAYSGGDVVPADGSVRPFSLQIDRLRLRRGESMACIGGSGAGKTTLVNLIAGILTPLRGRVDVLGASMPKLTDDARRRLRLARIGMVFQEFELLEYLSAFDNITIVRHLKPDIDRHAIQARARELADRAGIGPLIGRKPARLSQGERQRVALCRALVTNPELILSDEPTGNLDPDSTTRVLDLLLGYVADHRAGMLMVTHNHGLLDRFDRVVVAPGFAERSTSDSMPVLAGAIS